MSEISAARRRFRALLRSPESPIDLTEATLCIAWEDQGTIDLPGVHRELRTIAETARDRIAGAHDPATIVAALNDYLFDELGFHGNPVTFNEPSGSFIDQALRSRTGLPITLSVIYLDLARRLNLPIVGMAMPEHFMVRYIDPAGDIFIDPFRQGRLWTLKDCKAHLWKFYARRYVEVLPTVLEPPTERMILARMLTNLKQIYTRRAEIEAVLACIDRLQLINPDDADQLRDRGLMYARLGQFHRALVELDRYARTADDPPDRGIVEQYARNLAAQIVERN